MTKANMVQFRKKTARKGDNIYTTSMGTWPYPSALGVLRTNPRTDDHALPANSVAREKMPFGVGTSVLASTLLAGRVQNLRNKLLVMTLTLENAIAAAAVMGCRCHPHGRKTPMASGMPMML
jgi:hypothetical protein